MKQNILMNDQTFFEYMRKELYNIIVFFKLVWFIVLLLKMLVSN